MSSQRKIGVFLSYINIIAKNVVMFFYTPFLLSQVGQSQYGLFQMTNSVIASLSILSLGLSSAYIKFYMIYKTNEEQKKINQLNGLYMVMFTIIAIIALIIGLILAFTSKHIFSLSMSNSEIQLTKKLMIILAFNLALTFPSSVFDSNIMVNEQFKFQQFRQLLQTILVPLIAVPLIYFGMNVLAIGMTTALVTLLFLILNMRYCITKLHMKFEFKALSFGAIKPLLAFSSFIVLNQIVDMITNNGPSFILGITLGAREVAIFSIAVQIRNLFIMLSTSVSSVFIPKVNEVVNTSKDTEDLTSIMIRVGRVQMSVLLFIFGGFIILGQSFIEIWAGKENLKAYYLIIAMVFPGIVPWSQNIGIEIQRAMNMHVFRSVAFSIFAIFNLIITYLATLWLGIDGSVFGYIISVTIANGILMNAYYQIKMHLNMKRFWGNVLQVSIPFFIVTIILKIVSNYYVINSISVFLAYGIIYSVAYFFIYRFFIADDFEIKQLSMFRK